MKSLKNWTVCTVTMTGLWITCAMGAILTHAPLAHADEDKNKQYNLFLPEGSYAGKDANGDHEILMVRPFSGRKGSFLGMLIFNDKKAGRVYQIDPIRAGVSYSMTPLMTDEDGSPTTAQDPTLTLTFDGKVDDGLPGFSITQSGSQITAGYSGVTIHFKAGSTSHIKWTDFVAGRYKNGDNGDDKATLSPFDSANSQAIAEFGGALNGTYVLRQVVLGVYLVQKVVVSSTGSLVAENPSAVAIFVQDRLVIVDHKTGVVIARYKRD